jgi:hypothetical protein
MGLMVSDSSHFSKLEKLPSGLTAIPSLTIGSSKNYPQSSSHQSKNISPISVMFVVIEIQW